MVTQRTMAVMVSGWTLLGTWTPNPAAGPPDGRFGDAEQRLRPEPDVHVQVFEPQRIPVHQLHLLAD